MIGEIGPRERLEVDALDARVAPQLGEIRAQRMRPIEVIRATRGDQREPLADRMRR